MRGFAHPIGDTVEWCNETEGNVEEPSQETKPDTKDIEPMPGLMTKDDWAEKQRVERESIESQNALTNLTNAICAGVIDKTNPLFMAWQLIICSRLDIEVEKKVEKPTAPTPISTTMAKEAPQKVNEGIDIDQIKEDLKTAKWSEVAFRKWLHEQLGIDVSGTLTIVLGRLNDRQRETVLKEIQSRKELV